jgi:protein phosphatase
MNDNRSARSLFLYSTAVSDVGYVRSNNQDSAFAGERLVAICDGMGGHAGGDTASTIAIRSLAHIERDDTDSDVQKVAEMMETSVMAAHDAIVGKAKRERRLSGMGTTVTSVALVGGYWVLAHIGDSRAYLLRDGHIIRVTQDHSYVQHLINTGRISEAEAKNHPQRNVVMRVLGDFDIDPHPDISIRSAKPADRWLLCSDGLCGVLENSTIEETLASISDQEECAQRLVMMALKAGSTDNVTAVVADATLALDANAFDLPHQNPIIAGAASASLEPIADIVGAPVITAPKLREGAGSPAQRAAALSSGTGKPRSHSSEAEDGVRTAQPSSTREDRGDRQVPDTGEIPVVHKKDGSASADPNDPAVARAIHHKHVEQRQQHRSHKRRIQIIIASFIAAVAVIGAIGVFASYRWSQTQYYLGESDNVVTIYQGVPTNVFGLSLSHEVERTSITVSSLPKSWREQLSDGISVENLQEARRHANLIKSEANNLADDNSSASASASPSSSSSGSASSSEEKTS